jgi:hypothetical protein
VLTLSSDACSRAPSDSQPEAAPPTDAWEPRINTTAINVLAGVPDQRTGGPRSPEKHRIRASEPCLHAITGGLRRERGQACSACQNAGFGRCAGNWPSPQAVDLYHRRLLQARHIQDECWDRPRPLQHPIEPTAGGPVAAHSAERGGIVDYDSSQAPHSSTLPASVTCPDPASRGRRSSGGWRWARTSQERPNARVIHPPSTVQSPPSTPASGTMPVKPSHRPPSPRRSTHPSSPHVHCAWRRILVKYEAVETQVRMR